MPVQIAIAEDKELSLRSCMARLASFDEVRVIIQATNGQRLLDAMRIQVPDLVLMDIEMPVMDGIAATEAIRKEFPQVRILMLTTFDDDDKIFKAILAGASGYILKEESGADLLRAILETMEGGASMSPGIALKALNMIRNPAAGSALAEDFKLTRREVELLEQLRDGLSYEKIAGNLFISYGTVRKHIENIYRKLNVNNKVDAIRKAGQHRII